jgi:starch phosphorylase
MVRAWVAFTERPDVRERAVFVSDYDLRVAEMLVQDADVWINTPLRPWEACGTSGMKVLVNGGLNLSELDGWWSEAYAPEVGWSLGDGNVHPDAAHWDEGEAGALYERLEREIVPAFYERDEDGVSRGWLVRTRASMATLTPRFSTNRMTREYVDTLYAPAGRAYRRRAADGLRIARELEQWRGAVQQHWSDLRFGVVQTEGDPPGPYRVSVILHLGSVDPSSIRVELYADPESPGRRADRIVMEQGTTSHDGASLFIADVGTERPLGDYTPRVIPYHPAANVPIEATSILWQH